MPKTIRAVLDIVVDDFSAEDRREMANDADIPVREMPRLRDYSAFEIAEVLDELNEDVTGELFGGTGVYVRITDSKLISAEFVGD